MDKKSMQILDALAVKKQLALYLVGSAQNYQSYKRVQQMRQLYPNDFHYYNDTFYFRHGRNIQQLKKLITLIKQRKVTPRMLLYNTWNTFYPSYILNHHYEVYARIVELYIKQKTVAALYKQAMNLNKIGFFASRLFHNDIGKVADELPQIDQTGKVKMNQNHFFYDKHISLYAHICCFLATKGNEKVLVFVNLRTDKGQICSDVNLKDIGQRISSEYLQIGYNFSNTKVALALKITNEQTIKGIQNASYFQEFNLSLLDLKKSLFIAIKYTSMREQFKTLPESKAERTIITYQAVGVRLINAFSRLAAFSELNKALMNNRQILPFAAPLLDINHHLILDSVIRLRQCCGGFGYLQVAGHASSIEKLCLRASQAFVADVPQNPEILKRLHYFSSSDQMDSYFGSKITKEKAFNPSQIFAIFVSICVNMRKVFQTMSKQFYLREFMYQAAIQALKLSEQFTKIPKNSLPFLALHYLVSSYVLEHGKFISWEYIDSNMTRQQYLRGLGQFRDSYLNQLTSKFDLIEQILEVDHVRNVVIGRAEKQQFYHEVMKTSRENLRNSQEFVNYVKRPIVEMLHENNNAKL